MWFLHHKSHEPWAYLDTAFTNEECDNIIKLGKSLITTDATVGDYGDIKQNNNIRKNKVSWISVTDDTAWIYAKLTSYIININQQFWNFDLNHLETLQFTQYEEDADFYGPHIDLQASSFNFRKLSLSLQLSDPENYEGSDLIVHAGAYNTQGVYNQSVSKNRGDINFFPSYMLHEVTPLQRGTRYALVGWVNGPQFK